MKHEANLSRLPLLEVIVTSLDDALEAERGGAGRLEIVVISN